MNRIGHASRLKSAMNWMRFPTVTAPVDTRHEPMARSATVPRAGSASSAGSNPARMNPACTRSSRSARSQRSFRGCPRWYHRHTAGSAAEAPRFLASSGRRSQRVQPAGNYVGCSPRCGTGLGKWRPTWRCERICSFCLRRLDANDHRFRHDDIDNIPWAFRFRCLLEPGLRLLLAWIFPRWPASGTQPRAPSDPVWPLAALPSRRRPLAYERYFATALP